MSIFRCPYGVPITKYAFLSEILVELAKKVEYLEREKLQIDEKVMGMHFHMHALKITT